MMIKIFMLLSCVCGFISMIELELQNFVIEYVNPSFYNAVNVSIRRPNRHSPYYINMYIDYKRYVGDNYTLKVNVFEFIGGRNILTPIRLEYTICYFLKEDSWLGKMFREQMPRNTTCPFAPGIVEIKQLIFHTEQLPPLPIQIFTYASLSVKLCTEIEGLYVKEQVLLIKVYTHLKLKLQDRHRNNKSQPQRH